MSVARLVGIPIHGGVKRSGRKRRTHLTHRTHFLLARSFSNVTFLDGSETCWAKLVDGEVPCLVVIEIALAFRY
jgi:hypothetical protein